MANSGTIVGWEDESWRIALPHVFRLWTRRANGLSRLFQDGWQTWEMIVGALLHGIQSQ